VRALRQRRARFVAGCLAAIIGAGCMALSGPWRNELLAPGPLSTHHAHLIVHVGTTGERCAQCHAAGNSTLTEWLKGRESGAATQTALCMACHEKAIASGLATAAHNVPIEQLRSDGDVENDEAFWGSSRRDGAASIACSACHREHRGRNHDLTAISDAACQACHRERYHSFADEHPDFGAWPYERRTRIVFDHASHQRKHYPEEKQSFSCEACHQSDATGDRQLTRSYEVTCSACHDKSLAASLAEGVPLVALPTLDLAALSDAGHSVAPWPADADGDFDGAVPIFARLLLAADPQAAAAMEELGPAFDFYDLDPDNVDQVAAAAAVARHLKALIDHLAARGQPALADRVAVILGRDVTREELEAMAGRLSPDAADAFRSRWFAAAADAGESVEDRAAMRNLVPGGGWVRDDVTLSLRYHAAGHDDPWLRAWLDILAEAADGPRASVAAPLLQAALKPTAAGQCGSCHSLERNAAGRLAVQWHAFQPADGPRRLTYFSHKSHLLQTQLRDCTACHRAAARPDAAGEDVGDDPHQFVAGFEPLTKAACIECHTASAAGNACTQCHRYHGGGD
jgi:predicted CXXCH cytochrome family protein